MVFKFEPNKLDMWHHRILNFTVTIVIYQHILMKHSIDVYILAWFSFLLFGMEIVFAFFFLMWKKYVILISGYKNYKEDRHTFHI